MSGALNTRKEVISMNEHLSALRARLNPTWEAAHREVEELRRQPQQQER